MDETATLQVLLTAGVVIVGLLLVAFPALHQYRARKEKRMLADFAAHMQESERQGRGAEEWAAVKELHHRLLESQVQKGGGDAVYASYLLGSELLQEGDAEQASLLLLSAARSGLPQAQLQVANMYFSAGRTDDDASSALVWFYFAAEQGIPEAQAALGYCYAEGKGGEADQTKGYKWLRLASLAPDEAFPTPPFAGGPPAIRQLTDDLRTFRVAWKEASDALKSQLSPEQISLADTWVAAWEPKTWQDLSIAMRIPSSPRSKRKMASEEPLTCRVCGLINEPSASKCECGCPLS